MQRRSRGGATASHYDVLGVDPDASHDEVKRAYLDLALRWHPDRSPGPDEQDPSTAEWRMREVNEAWRVLRNPAARAAYDRTLARAPDDEASATSGTRRRADPGVDLRGAVSLEADRTASETNPPPWGWLLAGVAVIVGVLVLTAVADRREEPVDVRTRELLGVGSCVVEAPDRALVEVPCGEPHDAVVEARRRFPQSCPRGTSVVMLPDGESLVCLRMLPGSGS